MKDEKFLHWPVSPKIINQEFGSNKACVSLDGQNRVITCDGFNPPEGFRSLYGPNGHLGRDLGISHGQEVYNACEGVVDFIDTNPKSGLDIRIVSYPACFNGKRKFRHIYEHLLGYQPRVGDKVATGVLIGWGDNTGYSSGDHLHFQLEEWIDGRWVAVDPKQYMSDLYAKDVLWLTDKIKYLQEQVAKLADNLADYLRRRINK